MVEVPFHRQPFFGMWLSLVEHFVRDEGAAGSNPVIPTKERPIFGSLFML